MRSVADPTTGRRIVFTYDPILKTVMTRDVSGRKVIVGLNDETPQEDEDFTRRIDLIRKVLNND